MSAITKLKGAMSLYLESFRSTVNGDGYFIANPITLLESNGTIRLSNGQLLPFNKHNKKDMVNVAIFALENGVTFGSKKYDWKFHSSKNIIETPSGIKINVKGFDHNIISETFLYDIHFVDFDLSGKTVIDAGGFIGDTALYYASKGARVYSFEPDPNSYNIALSNLKLNPKLSRRITLENYALGKDGNIEFPINLNGSGGSSVYDSDLKQTLMTKSLSITGILKKYGLSSPYLLHLDVKGSEFDLIDDHAISKFQRVRIEYSPYLIKNENKGLTYLKTKLKKAGFNKMRVYKHNHLRYDLSYHGTIDAAK